MKRNHEPESRSSAPPQSMADRRRRVAWIAVLVGLPLFYGLAVWLLDAKLGPATLALHLLFYLSLAIVVSSVAFKPGVKSGPRGREFGAPDREPWQVLREPLADLRELAGDERRAGAARALGNALSALAPGGHGDLNLASVDLPGLMEEALRDWANCASSRGHELYGCVSPDLAPRVFSDAGRLRNVVDLMLFAGCYAAREGAIEFAAEAEREGDHGQWVSLSLDCGSAGNSGSMTLEAVRRVVHALGGSVSKDGTGGLHWRARLPFDAEALEAGEEKARPLADLRAHVAGDSPLAPTLRAYLQADGARLEDDPGDASVILLAESSRDGRAEALSQALKRHHPRVPLLCQAGIGELSGMLMEADGLLSLPVTRDGLRRQIRSVLPDPRQRRDAFRPLPEDRPERAVEETIDGEARVLVAEDDMISARVVCRFLEAEGVEVTRVADGVAALKHLEKGNIRLALLDMHMPKMDGLEVARRQRAREENSGRDRVKLVALTASAADEDRKACEDAGMDGFLTKPVERGELRKLIRQVETTDQPPD